jgi:N-acetylglucosaminyl-diphospho-decaprenol L-rhamnosyltransferase
VTAAAAGVAAVVVHHEQPGRCADTVRRLQSQGVPLARLVVVDNGSSVGALSALRASLPDGAELVEAGANLGFGGGANVGLRLLLDDGDGRSAWQWALVAPHDAHPDDGCLRALVDAAAARPMAGLASAEYGIDEKPVVDPYFGGMTVAATRGSGWEPAGFAHGTFLLLRRACLDAVGLFDESYFAYCEEADLAIRARAAGWEVGMVWGAVVVNPHQGTPPPVVDYLMTRNTIVLVRRHFGRYRASVRFTMAAVTLVWCWLRPSRRTPWYDARARAMALRDVVRGRLGPPPASVVVARTATMAGTAGAVGRDGRGRGRRWRGGRGGGRRGLRGLGDGLRRRWRGRLRPMR